MKTISIIIIMTLFLLKGETVLFDFNSRETSGKWNTINDDVMGGFSQSLMFLNENGTATFSGKVSLENNGGFASVRAPINNMEKSDFKGVILRLKGDGNVYNVRFRTSGNLNGYAYQSKVKTKENEWIEIKIPFEKFTPTYRGRMLTGKPTLESENIAQIGVLIADKQVGSFELIFDWIKFYE